MSRLRPPTSRLGWDVLLLVFEHLDRPTLAVLGRVCFDFLRELAPDLYRHIKLTKVKQLELLFCERREKKRRWWKLEKDTPSRIYSFLSLIQIRALSLDFTAVFPPARRLLNLSTDRFVSSIPTLPLDSVHLSLKYYERDLLGHLHFQLLPLLNPLRITYTGVHRPANHSPWIILYSAPLLSGWTRIQSVEISGIIPYPGPHSDLSFAFLPRPTRSVRREVRIQAGATLVRAGDRVSRSFFETMRDTPTLFGLDEMQDGSIVFLVGSEEEKRDVEEMLRTVLAQWRSVLVVELEEEVA